MRPSYQVAPAWEVDACVLGAGPAGALVAQRLARLGYEVVLVERRSASGPPRGESFPWSSRAMLRSIGIDAFAERAIYQRSDAAVVLWGSSRPEAAVGVVSALIDRGVFDASLRHYAISAGARLLMPARAQSAERIPSRGWRIRLVTSGGPGSVLARFLIDARGHRLGRALGPATIAMTGIWPKPGSDFGETRIEAGPCEWYWGSPQPDGSYGATVFVDAHRVARQSHVSRLALYRRLISETRLFQALGISRAAESVSLRDATFLVSPEPIREDRVLVGDAALALDPLSSQGLQNALRSAVHASASIHTLMAHGGDALAACEFYRTRQRGAAVRAQSAAAHFYAAAVYGREPFWRARSCGAVAAPTAPATREIPSAARLRVSDVVRMQSVAVLAGERVSTIRALNHPDLDEPVAFLGNVAIAPLVARLDAPLAPSQILERWSRCMPLAEHPAVLQWMWDRGLLVEA